MLSSTTLFSSKRRVQRARPLGGLETRQGDQLGFFLAIKDGGNCRRRPLFAAQHRLKTLFHQLLADPVNHRRAGFQGGNDLAVAPPSASFRDVGLQQNPGLEKPLCRAFSSPNQGLKLLAFPSAQPHNISLHRVLVRPHSPSVARTTTEANHQILSNWLKRATSAPTLTH